MWGGSGNLRRSGATTREFGKSLAAGAHPRPWCSRASRLGASLPLAPCWAPACPVPAAGGRPLRTGSPKVTSAFPLSLPTPALHLHSFQRNPFQPSLRASLCPQQGATSLSLSRATPRPWPPLGSGVTWVPSPPDPHTGPSPPAGTLPDSPLKEEAHAAQTPSADHRSEADLTSLRPRTQTRAPGPTSLPHDPRLQALPSPSSGRPPHSGLRNLLIGQSSHDVLTSALGPCPAWLQPGS